MWTGIDVVHFVTSGDTRVAITFDTNAAQVGVFGHPETDDAPEFFLELLHGLSRPEATHTELLKKTKTDERMERITNAIKD